jgi:hypothetical protein
MSECKEDFQSNSKIDIGEETEDGNRILFASQSDSISCF